MTCVRYTQSVLGPAHPVLFQGRLRKHALAEGPKNHIGLGVELVLNVLNMDRFIAG